MLVGCSIRGPDEGSTSSGPRGSLVAISKSNAHADCFRFRGDRTGVRRGAARTHRQPLHFPPRTVRPRIGHCTSRRPRSRQRHTKDCSWNRSAFQRPFGDRFVRRFPRSVARAHHAVVGSQMGCSQDIPVEGAQVSCRWRGVEKSAPSGAAWRPGSMPVVVPCRPRCLERG